MENTIVGTTNVFGTSAKSILLEQYPDSAWTWISGKPDDENSVGAFAKSVPWLYRGLGVIVQGVSDVPVYLMKGNRELGLLGGEMKSSTLNLVDDLPVLLKKVAGSLVMEGSSYAFKDRAAKTQDAVGIKKLWYWVSSTVTFDAQKTRETKILSFKRQVPGGQQEPYTDKDVVYFWLPDPQVELGPPTSCPAKAALAASSVLFNKDNYVAQYFKSGAVRAYVFSKEGAPPSESEQDNYIKKFTKSLFGMSRAFRALFISGAVKLDKIGDGLEGLQNTELTKEAREDISTALGIPQSILWSTESGGLGGSGVTTEDTFRFYSLTIVPLIKFIVGELNKQVLKESGYSLVVRENEMDVFQEDETSRASAMGSLVSSLKKPDEFLIAASILGYDLTEEQIAEIKAMSEERKKAAEEIQGNMTDSDAAPKEEEEEEETDDGLTKRLAAWRRFTTKRGKESVTKFDTNGMDQSVVDRVIKSVSASTTQEELGAAFDVKMPKSSEVNTILEAMRIEMSGMRSAPQSGSNVIIDTTGRHLEEIEVKNMKRSEDVVSAINVMANRLDKQIVIPAPVVNVSVPETVVNIPAPVVNVRVPEQAAPVVNIEPAQVKVSTPRIKRSKQKVTKDNDGRVVGSETEYEY